MPKYGTTSKSRLSTCDKRLQKIFNEAIKYIDITIVEGHRGRERQDKAFREEKSNAEWPHSKHNTNPSLAVDVAPYDSFHRRINWNDIEGFMVLSDIIKGIAKRKRIKIVWGGDFKSLKDYGHFELND